jgi:hypothetical protein
VYGPKRRDDSARSTSADPSAICARFQSDSILIGEQHQFAGGRRACAASRLVQQHQGKQAHRLRFRQQLHQQPAETDRLAR